MTHAIFVLGLILAALGEDEIRRFDNEELNHAPSGFRLIPQNNTARSEWQIAQDGENRVLARLEKSKAHVALAIDEKFDLEDLVVSVRIKAIAGGDQSGGLVWRYSDSKNYLLARLDFEDKRVRLYRIVNGNRVKFGEEDDLRLKKNTWYTLRVEHRDDKIKVYLDDDAVIVERDKHFKKAGGVGLYADEKSETYFDDLHVRPLDVKK